MQKRRVMIFGVFDLLHEGHISAIKQARGFGKLLIVVARDSAVMKIKKRKPKENQRTRIRKIRLLGLGGAVLGDRAEGSYAVVRKYHPDLICLGYDQKSLKNDLRAKIAGKLLPKINLRMLKACRPRKYHSSIV